MNLRKTLTLAGLVLLLVVADLSPAAATAKAGGTVRPISGSGSVTTTANLLTGTFVSDGSGVITHLGANTSHTEGILVPTGSGTSAVNGTVTFVAANRDRLSATVSGTSTVNGPTLLAFAFSGGTGRFENASGTMTSEGLMTVVSFDGVTAVLAGDRTLTGHISY